MELNIQPCCLGNNLAPLIVRRAHQRVLQKGVKATLTEVRPIFWIVKGHVCQEKIHKCAICKKFKSRAFVRSSPSPLPELRLTEAPSFTFTGSDFAGLP